jgi:uncharacterized RDD family membrane protein YckC/ribosomal protein S27AE
MEMRMTTFIDIIGNNKALQDHWVRRIVAYIIDWIILVIIGAVIGFALIVLAPWQLWGFLFTGLLAFLYFVLSEILMGATLGKKLMSLEVVSTTPQAELDAGSVLFRNFSKLFGPLLLIDWIVGMFQDGDPRQKLFDRYANTVVQRTDQQAYMEQQFKQMAYVPPHPTYQPPPGQPQQPSYQPAPQPQQQPQQQPQGQAWPHQEQQPKPDWPEHDPGQAPPQQQPQAQPQQSYEPPPQQQPQAQPQQSYQPQQQAGQPLQQDAPRFCQNCGTTLTVGADGRPACGNCGKTY